MKRSAWAPVWFLLVPYFAVASLNAPPWPGESRKSANRTNAQLALVLIMMSPIFFTLAGTGLLSGRIPRQHPFLFSLAVMLPVWALVSIWLKSEREAQYNHDYAAMSQLRRSIFGLGTAAFLITGFFLFIVPR